MFLNSKYFGKYIGKNSLTKRICITKVVALSEHAVRPQKLEACVPRIYSSSNASILN
jgi:hypothetical protein